MLYRHDLKVGNKIITTQNCYANQDGSRIELSSGRIMTVADFTVHYDRSCNLYVNLENWSGRCDIVINDIDRGCSFLNSLEQEIEQPTKVCSHCGCCNKLTADCCWYCKEAP